MRPGTREALAEQEARLRELGEERSRRAAEEAQACQRRLRDVCAEVASLQEEARERAAVELCRDEELQACREKAAELQLQLLECDAQLEQVEGGAASRSAQLRGALAAEEGEAAALLRRAREARRRCRESEEAQEELRLRQASRAASLEAEEAEALAELEARVRRLSLRAREESEEREACSSRLASSAAAWRTESAALGAELTEADSARAALRLRCDTLRVDAAAAQMRWLRAQEECLERSSRLEAVMADEGRLEAGELDGSEERRARERSLERRVERLDRELAAERAAEEEELLRHSEALLVKTYFKGYFLL